MWTRRNAFSFAELPDSPLPSIASSASAPNAHSSDAEDNVLHFISSLAYVLIPSLLPEEASALLDWAFPHKEKPNTPLSQVEYFLVGTDHGGLYLFPLFPNHWAKSDARSPRRLLHQHRRGEPVVSIATLGALVSSCSTDGAAHVSRFHPNPCGVASLSHPCGLRAVHLWDGAVFASRVEEETQRASILSAEASAAYLFTGDENGVVRMWRLEVDARRHMLTAVFAVCDASGLASPLQQLEWGADLAPNHTRRRARPIYALLVDEGAARLLAATDGGVVVWSLSRLPWRNTEATHALTWNEETSEAERGPLNPRLRARAERLVNAFVWVKHAECLRCALQAGRHPLSGWKPKYATHIANGSDIGLVCNVPRPPPPTDDGEEVSLEVFLRETAVPVHFPALRNAVTFPLEVLEPAVRPFRLLVTAGRVCLALLLLQPNRRLVVGASDGSVSLWVWCAAEETYVLTLSTGAESAHGGLGRHLCLLRSPDVFISCGYEDGVVKEWHVYDEPELLMRCERRFTLLTAESYPPLHGCPQQVEKRSGKGMGQAEEKRETVSGVACAVTFPFFHALFLVGAFETTIQAMSLSEVQGCEPPSDYIYNGYKTVQVLTNTDETLSSTLF